MDTIFALASAQGKAGVAIVRVSGPDALGTVQAMCGSIPEFRRGSLRNIADSDGTLIDRGLVLTFPKGASFTGEDVAEFHLHGSRAVIASVLRCLSNRPNHRLAEAGEFTRRALENGCLDLTEVEGLADLIDAETEAQRKQALRVLSGELGDRANNWRLGLIRAAALLEASIDFADEDVPEDVSDEVMTLVTDVRSGLVKDHRGMSAAERIRDGFEVAIVGSPNVGKSTLLNAIAGRDAAITSEIAGTTRDVVEVRMDLAGLAVTFLDTAGLRETSDVIENIGIQRARDRARTADLRVFLLLPGEQPMLDVVEGDLVVAAKADLADHVNGVSGLTGLGVEQLLHSVTTALVDRAGEAGLATRERHRVAMTRAIVSLDVALELVRTGQTQYDIAAEEIRSAIRALESLIGSVDVENLLDEIFSSFCVGK